MQKPSGIEASASLYCTGPILRFPVVALTVNCHMVQLQPAWGNPTLIAAAAADCLRKCLSKAQCRLLEPLAEVEVVLYFVLFLFLFFFCLTYLHYIQYLYLYCIVYLYLFICNLYTVLVTTHLLRLRLRLGYCSLFTCTFACFMRVDHERRGLSRRDRLGQCAAPRQALEAHRHRHRRSGQSESKTEAEARAEAEAEAGGGGGGAVLELRALCPLAELARYSSELRSLCSGAASFSFRPCGYTPLPAHLQAQLIDQTLGLGELHKA